MIILLLRGDMPRYVPFFVTLFFGTQIADQHNHRVFTLIKNYVILTYLLNTNDNLVWFLSSYPLGDR
jgi:hypothetical protein